MLSVMGNLRRRDEYAETIGGNAGTYRALHFESLSDILQGWPWDRRATSDHCDEYSCEYHQ